MSNSAPSPKVAAFFDLDETVIRGASSWVLTRELYRRKFFGRKDIVFAARQALYYLIFGEDRQRVEQIKNRALSVMAGHSIEEVKGVVTAVNDLLYRSRLFPGAKKLIDRHIRAGHDIWLITAAPEALAENLAERLGMTGGIGTRIKVKNGVYQPALDGELMHGQGKRMVVEQLSRIHGYQLDKCFAYSDSLNDLPLLSMVGKPSVINPDPRLRLWAISRGWPVIDFRAHWQKH